MLLFAGMYRSLVCGLHASGGQSLPPPMLGQNSAPCFAPGRLDSSTVGRPVFESIDVNTLLLENGEGETIAIQYPKIAVPPRVRRSLRRPPVDLGVDQQGRRYFIPVP